MWSGERSSIEILFDVLIFIGLFFVLVAAIGVWRLRDVYERLHATTKSGTMGLIAVLGASFIYFWGEGELLTKQILTLAFLMLTVPAAAHLLSRAGYMTGVQPDELWLDEMGEHVGYPLGNPEEAEEASEAAEAGESITETPAVPDEEKTDAE